MITQKVPSRIFTGYLLVFLTIFIWGTTFVSTKVLLQSFTPLEILMIRYLIGYICLWIISRKWFPVTNLKTECLFAVAGLCGITFYQLLENIALNYSLASNVCVIVSTAPFFTNIFMKLFSSRKKEIKLSFRFFIGFAFAILGISIISFNGYSSVKLNPMGDLLALLASITWAIYSVILNKINESAFDSIIVTRRMFFYALIFMIPFCFFGTIKMDFANIQNYLTGKNIGNIVFLGVGASAFCFAAWNKALRFVGVVNATFYIYLIPVVTLVFSVVILHEPLNLISIGGIVLTFLGLVISEDRIKLKKKLKNSF